jgi:hypothetical protein
MINQRGRAFRAPEQQPDYVAVGRNPPPLRVFDEKERLRRVDKAALRRR